MLNLLGHIDSSTFTFLCDCKKVHCNNMSAGREKVSATFTFHFTTDNHDNYRASRIITFPWLDSIPIPSSILGYGNEGTPPLSSCVENSPMISMWPTLESMQVVPLHDQIFKQCRWCHLVAQFVTDARCATWWLNLQSVQVVPTGDHIYKHCQRHNRPRVLSL